MQDPQSRTAFKAPWLLTKDREQKTLLAYKALAKAFDDCGIELRHAVENSEIQGQSADLFIVMGGDGTLLSWVRRLNEQRHLSPILGVHSSKGLGFMHPCSLPETPDRMTQWSKSIVDALIKGRYQSEKLWGLEYQIFDSNLKAKIKCGDCAFWALNDLVISKGSLSRMLSLKLSVDNELLLDRYRGDGLIVASACGSSAYSLSAGGPLVHPSLGVTVLSPICPQQLSLRPLVIDSQMPLKIEVLENSAATFVTEDGQNGTELSAGDSIVIQRSKNSLALLTPQDQEGLGMASYFSKLKRKLGWKPLGG